VMVMVVMMMMMMMIVLQLMMIVLLLLMMMMTMMIVLLLMMMMMLMMIVLLLMMLMMIVLLMMSTMLSGSCYGIFFDHIRSRTTTLRLRAVFWGLTFRRTTCAGVTPASRCILASLPIPAAMSIARCELHHRSSCCSSFTAAASPSPLT
jgi:hypothetical protein